MWFLIKCKFLYLEKYLNFPNGNWTLPVRLTNCSPERTIFIWWLKDSIPNQVTTFKHHLLIGIWSHMSSSLTAVYTCRQDYTILAYAGADVNNCTVNLRVEDVLLTVSFLHTCFSWELCSCTFYVSICSTTTQKNHVSVSQFVKCAFACVVIGIVS